MFPLFRVLWAAAGTLAAPALRLMLWVRARRGKEIAARLGERRGIAALPRPAGKLLWLHAASVGETVSLLPVLGELARQAPEISVLLTTGTVTSAELLAARLPALGLAGRVTHGFVPLDVPAWVARFLDHWRPDAAAFVESELWPNLLAACTRRGIPLMLINARLSARSFARWRCWPSVARGLLGGFASIRARSAEDAARFAALGAPTVRAVGDLKFAAAELPADPAALAALRAAIGPRPVFLAASTHPGEDAIILAVHHRLAARHPDLLTILVPRHPARGGAIASLPGAAMAPRRSTGAGPPGLREGGVYIADTLGELGVFYRLASLAFIGGSLVAHGGQNPLEAARLGVALVIGPYHQNFAEAVVALAGAGAARTVRDGDELATVVGQWLDDPKTRAAMAAAGPAAAARFADLPAATAAALRGLVGRRR
ncbi:MAG: 3-deoxy-D-manno-octulosonic acid transferase [Acidibrevibacterium sp.]|uniref:3-deoxy-D-manno-octulosonic acid transferase n=1 Tax=Acidibrevibacterium sp. TaxID=2606776 RepID=UPI003CFE5010